LGTGPDLKSALKECDLTKPVILLSHQPDIFKQSAGYNIDLQLSGHTHAGQILPMRLFSECEIIKVTLVTL